MSIIRYTASADTTITNAFEANLVTRGSGSNMGYADSLEVFSISGQESGSNGQSQELSRILIQFPIETVAANRTAGSIPASGSVSFHLKMANAEHPFTLPQDFNLIVAPVSRSWSEGAGLDMDEYKDLGQANWGLSKRSTAWTNQGGDYLTASNYNVHFAQGYEDLSLDVSEIVERWLTAGNEFTNYGFGIHLTASQEAYFSSSLGSDSGSVIQNTVGATQSYYTKKFFARSSEFFFKRPALEARWNSSTKDDRENFYFSSSLAPAADNLNKLGLYNYVRGRLVNIPAVGINELRVSFYSSSFGVPTGSKLSLPVGGDVATAGDTNATASYTSAGLYSVNLALTAASTPLLEIHDVWHSGGVEFFTGSFYPELIPTYDSAPTFNRITSCKNLKKKYSTQDKARFRFFVRDRNWSPTVYNVAKANNPTDIIESASFAIYRTTDNYAAISYGTGSDLCTMMSYDKEGNYFDLDMSLLEPDFMYEIKLSYYNDSIGDWQEQPQTFKFRVEE
ncbi:MAG TPA: hypothetical protein EYN67_13875 [Flavobacteriales bacterium]|nr:hypothetical protein [Flavobacteriales bacterium]